MAKKKAPLNYEVLVSPHAEWADRHDVQDLVDEVMNLAGCECGGGAHVYEHAGWVVVSAAPMSRKQVCRIAHEEERKLMGEAEAEAVVN